MIAAQSSHKPEMSLETKSILTPFIKSLLLTPPNLKPSDLSLVIKLIVQGLPTDIQIASFLTALRVTKLDNDPEYIAAAAAAVLAWSDAVETDELVVDIVGTGGDGQNTFNVSTSSAIVAAGMGIKVCKHGGKASTSTSGAGDLLGALGVDLTKINGKTASGVIEKSMFTFLFAPNFHPAMKKVAHIRALIGIPTIFNVLGPLMNPAPVKARIIGVNSESLGPVFAQAVLSLDKQRFNRVAKSLIVWGCIGLDEISPVGRTKCWLVEPATESITSFYLEPKDFGLEEHELDTVASGTPQENADLLLKILEGRVSDHPVLDYILMNSSALAVVSGAARNWKQGASLARNSIKSGAALESLETLRDVVNGL